MTISTAASWAETWGTVADIVAAILTAVTLVGVYLVLDQIKLQRKQMHRDLENLYVERYWTILDRLECAAPGSPEHRQAVRAYLSLCEDQCDMRQQDRVTDETWVVWGPSMHNVLGDSEYAETLSQAPESSYLHLRRMKSAGSGYDPTETPLKRRAKSGL